MYYLDEMKPHAGVSEQDMIDEAMDLIEAQEASRMHKMNQPTGVSEQIQTNLHHYREVLRKNYENVIDARERGVSRMVKKILEIIPDFDPTDLYSESDSESDGYDESFDRNRRYVPLHLRRGRKESLRKEGLRMKKELKIEQRNFEEMKAGMLGVLQPTDADFLNSRVEAVQTEWCVGTKDIYDFDHIAQSIKDLLSIRPPYAVTFPSIHVMATWLYNKSGDFPAPETADAVFHHLQVMSDQFEREGIDPETNKDLKLYIDGERVGRRDLPNKTVLSTSEFDVYEHTAELGDIRMGK